MKRQEIEATAGGQREPLLGGLGWGHPSGAGRECAATMGGGGFPTITSEQAAAGAEVLCRPMVRGVPKCMVPLLPVHVGAAAAPQVHCYPAPFPEAVLRHDDTNSGERLPALRRREAQARGRLRSSVQWVLRTLPMVGLLWFCCWAMHAILLAFF